MYIGVHRWIPQEYGDRQQNKGRFRLVLKDIQAKEYSALANLTPKVLFCSCVRACVRRACVFFLCVCVLVCVIVCVCVCVCVCMCVCVREGGREAGREGEKRDRA